MKKSASDSTFFITLLIISFSSLLIAAQNPKCHPQDQIAINIIQTAFGLTPTPNCCDWDAVTCSDDAPFRVTQFRIYDNSTISGQIPAAIGDLSSLETFWIDGAPKITGYIPPAITKLTNLSQLTISGTSLSGPIPSFLANLTNLGTLELSFNALTGPVPTFLANLKKLSFLDLSFNALTGPIPAFLANLNNLWLLSLSHNALTGPIPAFLANLKNLEFLYLSNNALTGSIPPQLSKLRKLNLLDLSGNKLTGSIPESFGYFSSNMSMTLFLSNCSLKGAIPKSLGNSNIQYLDLSQNSFTGDASFLFGKNKITHYIFLGENKLKFNLSNVEFPLNLEGLNLAHNHIFGRIPQQISQLNNLDLDYFSMSYNDLCGPIPWGLEGDNGAAPFSHNKCLCDAPLPPCKK